jgi:hypothetical protein
VTPPQVSIVELFVLGSLYTVHVVREDRVDLTARDSLSVDGVEYAVSAAPFRFRGPDDATARALAIAGGAVAGVLLGKVVGGDALKGRRHRRRRRDRRRGRHQGNPIVLPAGARLRVELTEPVTVTARPSERSDRPGAEEQR